MSGGKEILINGDLAYYSILEKSFLKSQISTTNTDLSKSLLWRNILWPFRIYRSGKILKNGMTSTLNFCLYIHIAVLCLPALKTTITRRARRWKRAPLSFIQCPLEHLCPFSFVSVSSRVPARNRWHTEMR